MQYNKIYKTAKSVSVALALLVQPFFTSIAMADGAGEAAPAITESQRDKVESGISAGDKAGLAAGNTKKSVFNTTNTATLVGVGTVTAVAVELMTGNGATQSSAPSSGSN